MNFSAASSSSPVVTPGLIFPATRFIVLTRIAPAAAIRSISSGVFLMITCAPLDIFLEAKRRNHRPDVVVNLGRLARAVDPPHQPPLVVVLDERLGLVVVDLEAVANDLGLVVVALDQPRAVLVADIVVLGRIELDVVVVAALDAHPAAGQAPLDLLVGHVD